MVSDCHLKMFTDEQLKTIENPKMDEKMAIDLSEIKVDEQDLTPVEMSENVLCSQDLAQLVMTQAFANFQKDKTPPATKREVSPIQAVHKPEIKSALRPPNVVSHKTSNSIGFKEQKVQHVQVATVESNLAHEP